MLAQAGTRHAHTHARGHARTHTHTHACIPPPFPAHFAHATRVFMQGRTLYMMPAVRDMHEVSITFQLPSLFEQYRSKAEHYISHLLGHEGAGSLCSLLKVRQLCVCVHVCARMCVTVTVCVTVCGSTMCTLVWLQGRASRP